MNGVQPLAPGFESLNLRRMFCNKDIGGLIRWFSRVRYGFACEQRLDQVLVRLRGDAVLDSGDRQLERPQRTADFGCGQGPPNLIGMVLCVPDELCARRALDPHLPELVRLVDHPVGKAIRVALRVSPRSPSTLLSGGESDAGWPGQKE